MLTFTFFSAVFSSVSWLIYAVMLVSSKLSENGLWLQEPEQILVMLAIVFLPVLVIWVAFGFVNQFAATKAMDIKQTELLKQLQKNQDYTDLVVRVMLDAEHEIKDGFVINKFDMFIADMNEALGEIIQRCNIASSAQLEQLWQRVKRGEKWTLGKAVLDASKSQSTFNAWVKEKVNRDKVFKGTLLEFCSRYQNLLQLLEKHDRDRIFLRIVETGVFGKVYSIIAPLSEGLNPQPEEDGKIFFASQKSTTKSVNDYSSVLKLATMEEPTASETIVNVDKDDEEEKESDDGVSFFSRINPFKKDVNIDSLEDEKTESDMDPFFQALHNSFKNEDTGLSASNNSFEDASPNLKTFSDDFKNDVSLFSSREDVHFSLDSYTEKKVEREDVLPELKVLDVKEEKTPVSVPFGGVRETLNSLRSLNNSMLEQKKKEPSISEFLDDEKDEKTISSFFKAKENVGEVEVQKKEPVSEVNTTISAMNRQVESSVQINKAEDDEDMAYPFGGWTDEENYRK